MKLTEHRFEASDGETLHINEWASESSKGIVQILHGMAEYGARYERLAKRLNDSGYTVYAHDHRGHGRSLFKGYLKGHMADSDSWNRIVEDAHDINRKITAMNPGIPILMLGHSMGSFALQQLLFEHPGDMVAAALSGSSGKPPPVAMIGKVLARIERARVGRRNSSPILDRLSYGEFNRPFKPARTEFDWLSRDQAEVDKYDRDPLMGFSVSTQTWLDLLTALERIAKPHNVGKIPKKMVLLLITGARDSVTNFGKGTQDLYGSYKKAGLEDVRMRIYPEGRHEMFNEINRDEVTGDFVDWCDTVTQNLNDRS